MNLNDILRFFNTYEDYWHDEYFEIPFSYQYFLIFHTFVEKAKKRDIRAAEETEFLVTNSQWKSRVWRRSESRLVADDYLGAKDSLTHRGLTLLKITRADTSGKIKKEHEKRV